MQQKTIKISKKKLQWLVLILIILGLWWAFQTPRYYPMPFMGVSEDQSVTSGGSRDMMLIEGEIAPDYYPRGYYGSPDITDDRQFLKTNYSAHIKTRDVKTIIRNIKGIVSLADGRIDNLQESEKYGYVGFVIPKDNLESFRDEIESLTYSKLITVDISSQNLLGQKQNIEDQMNSATSSLADLTKQKTNLTAKHNQTLAGLNAQLATLQNQGTSTDAERAVIRQSIEKENRSYNSQLANLDNQIDSTKKWIENVEKRDVDFGNNIETVSGNISVNWVSVWEMIKTFTAPVHPGWIILILVAIAYKPLARLGIIPKIQLV